MKDEEAAAILREVSFFYLEGGGGVWALKIFKFCKFLKTISSE